MTMSFSILSINGELQVTHDHQDQAKVWASTQSVLQKTLNSENKFIFLQK